MKPTRTITDLVRESQAAVDATPVADTFLLTANVQARDTMREAERMLTWRKPT